MSESAAVAVAPHASVSIPPTSNAVRVRRWVGWIMLSFLVLVGATAAVRFMAALLVLRRPGLEAVVVFAGLGAVMALAIGAAALAARRWSRCAVLAAVVGAILVRLAPALALELPQRTDWRTYMLLAEGLTNGAPPFSDRPMGWPILLAGAWELIGASVRTGVLLNVALSSLTAVVLALWLWRLAGPAAAAIGVTLWALLPSPELFDLLLGTEVTYTFLALLIAVVLYLALSRRRQGRHSPLVLTMLAAGILLGLSYWVRTTSLVVLPFIAVLPWVVGATPRRAIAAAGTLMLAAALLLVPNTVFNRVELDRWSPSNSLYAGWQLFVGNNEQTAGRFNKPDEQQLEALLPLEARVLRAGYATGILPLTAIQEQARADDEMLRRGLDRVGSHGLAWPAFLLRKVDAAWSSGASGTVFALSKSVEPNAPRPIVRGIELFADASWIGLIVLAALWYWRFRADPGVSGMIVAALTLPIAASLLLLEAQPRYHEYVVPLFVALAAATLAKRFAPPTRVKSQLVV